MAGRIICHGSWQQRLSQPHNPRWWRVCLEKHVLMKVTERLLRMTDILTKIFEAASDVEPQRQPPSRRRQRRRRRRLPQVQNASGGNAVLDDGRDCNRPVPNAHTEQVALISYVFASHTFWTCVWMISDLHQMTAVFGKHVRTHG